MSTCTCTCTYKYAQHVHCVHVHRCTTINTMYMYVHTCTLYMYVCTVHVYKCTCKNTALVHVPVDIIHVYTHTCISWMFHVIILVSKGLKQVQYMYTTSSRDCLLVGGLGFLLTPLAWLGCVACPWPLAWFLCSDGAGFCPPFFLVGSRLTLATW